MRITSDKKKTRQDQHIKDAYERQLKKDALILYFVVLKNKIRGRTRTNYVKFHIYKTVESPLCRICGVESKTVSHTAGESKMHANIFIGDYVTNMSVKQHHNGRSTSQRELFRIKNIRFCGILKYSVIS